MTNGFEQRRRESEAARALHEHQLTLRDTFGATRFECAAAARGW
jgi:hypothetical protein